MQGFFENAFFQSPSEVDLKKKYKFLWITVI